MNCRDTLNESFWKENQEKINHFNIICDFLEYLNSKTSDFILKGGTSLMMGYGLDRFSEDIDLDSTNKQIEKYISAFCSRYNFSYRIATDTNTTKRYMIHYSDTHKPLKIEISYKQRNISEKRYTKINGMTIYKINEIFGMKMNAYNSRDNIRDLYDVVFIVKNYYSELSEERIDIFKDILSYKGLEQFDYLIQTQSDELIDNDKLAEDFLNVLDTLGVLDDHMVSSSINQAIEYIYKKFGLNVSNEIAQKYLNQYSVLDFETDSE